MTDNDTTLLSRRQALVIGGVGVAGLIGLDQVRAIAAALGAEENATCVLAPEMTEGPFYLDGEKVRRNITEGKAGIPLALGFTVVNATTCRPIRNAAVEIWHCDALGNYSGVQGQTNRTFLRGIQKTTANGKCSFQTIYPGWYRGRTIHIHVKVFVGGNEVHTGQVFFADSVSDAVVKSAPYNTRGTRDTFNRSDGIFQGGGSKSLVTPRRTGARGYAAALTMGVKV